MSIWTNYKYKLKLCALFCKLSKQGFWIIELLVSVAILSGFMLILFRFGCNMIATKHDAIMRLGAMNHAISHLEGDFGRKLGENHNFNQKIGNFELICKSAHINKLESNLPEAMKKELKKHANKKYIKKYTVSWVSSFENKRNIELFSCSR